MLQNWLGQINTDNITKYKIVNDRTNLILSTLGFDWKKIDENKIINFLAIDLAYKAVNNVMGNEKTLESLILISELVPVPYYWLSTDKKFIGINEAELPIELNKLQQSILYLISHGKSYSEISSYIESKMNLELSSQLISSIINSQLYQKFDVNNTNDLLFKAYKYNLIPLYLE